MSKPSAKKQKKQKARERVVAKRKVLLAEKRRYAESFPEFIFKTNNAPDEFVDLIRKAVKKIDFSNSSQFRSWEKAFFKGMKKNPRDTLAAVSDSTGNAVLAVHLISLVGRLVFSSIPREVLLRWIPFHDVQFVPNGHNITVLFRSLEQRKSDGGTIYYSRHKPTLTIDSEEKIIGWSRHAIERTCERLSLRWDTYLGMGEIFAFFDQCIHFELTTLHGDQLAFTFYESCPKHFSKRQFVSEVLGSDDGGDGYYFRFGYCPAVIDGDFIKATTLLVPGYKRTPEYGAILQSDLSRDEKRQMIEEATQMTMARLAETDDFSLVRWFHNNGVPQVIHTDAELYVPPV